MKEDRFISRNSKKFDGSILNPQYLSVQITEIYSHAFLQKFRESNVFTNEVTE